MSSRVYGATEDKILARLERDLHVARTEEGASWRMLAALIVGAATPLSEAVGEPWGTLVMFDPEPVVVRTANGQVVASWHYSDNWMGEES